MSKSGQPDVAPVAFEFDGEYFYIGGREMVTTRKFKNVRDGNKKVALAFDDVAPTSRKVMGVRIHGSAEIVERVGRFGNAKYIRVAPKVSWSWGIEGLPLKEGGIFYTTVH